MGFFENIQEKTQQLKEKTQNSRQKLKVSAKSKTRFAENASKKKAWLKYSKHGFAEILVAAIFPLNRNFPPDDGTLA